MYDLPRNQQSGWIPVRIAPIPALGTILPAIPLRILLGTSRFFGTPYGYPIDPPDARSEGREAVCLSVAYRVKNCASWAKWVSPSALAGSTSWVLLGGSASQCLAASMLVEV